MNWLWSHCLSDIEQCISSSLNLSQDERKEISEKRIHEIGNKLRKCRGSRRKDESNEKLKENNTERNTFRAFQRDGEINDSDTEMQT